MLSALVDKDQLRYQLQARPSPASRIVPIIRIPLAAARHSVHDLATACSTAGSLVGPPRCEARNRYPTAPAPGEWRWTPDSAPPRGEGWMIALTAGDGLTAFR